MYNLKMHNYMLVATHEFIKKMFFSNKIMYKTSAHLREN